jgi:Mn2+/Fe2+ NRAMP family transporter
LPRPAAGSAGVAAARSRREGALGLAAQAAALLPRRNDPACEPSSPHPLTLCPGSRLPRADSLPPAPTHPGREEVDITDAYNLLAPSLGAKAASIIFAIALLASGQNSTITGTLAGQIVLEGFLDLKMRPWLRRLLTRAVAIVPAAVVAAVLGEAAVGKLLIFSQVILSLQLPFAMLPLLHFTSSKRFVGPHASGWFASGLAWFVGLAITALNVFLLVQLVRSGGAV